MLITPTTLTALFTAYSFAYQAGFTTAEVFWRTLATMVPSATESNTYAWMEKIPKVRKWLGPRVVQNVVARAPRIVINDPYELTLEVPKYKIQDDQYGLYTPTATMMGMQAAKWPDDVVSAKVLENPVAFDGVTFFHDSHPVNLDDASMGTYDNIETSFPLTATNYATARARMRGYKGADGRRIGVRPNLLVVPPSLETRARTIVQSQYLPQLVDGGTNAQGGVGIVENVNINSAEVLVIDDLEDAPLNWYLFDMTKAIKPYIFQLRQAPVFTYLINPNDPNVFFNKNFIMGCEMRGAADATLPFLAFQGQG